MTANASIGSCKARSNSALLLSLDHFWVHRWDSEGRRSQHFVGKFGVALASSEEKGRELIYSRFDSHLCPLAERSARLSHSTAARAEQPTRARFTLRMALASCSDQPTSPSSLEAFSSCRRHSSDFLSAVPSS